MTTKILKKQETGRSMIEMLGVLAVIGVLSVGGIAGYTSAMNKHRANELLHQVSMRATSCVAQIEAGNTPSVSDFGDYDGYSFTVAANPSNANQFQLTISGKDIPEAVCNNMKNAEGSSTPIRNINAGCTVITYNNDMGTTVYNSDYNGDPDHCPGKYCTGSNTCVDTGADCTCSGTIAECKVCDTDTGNIVNATNGTECTGGTCQSGTCEATISTDPCSQCLTAGYDVKCLGTDCSACIVPIEYDIEAGQPCVSASNCSKQCDLFCFDNYSGGFESCCLDGPGGGTCSNYF